MTNRSMIGDPPILPNLLPNPPRPSTHPAGTVGTPREGNRSEKDARGLLAVDLSATFQQTGTPTLNHRGSGWVALALRRCLALGATTSTLSKSTGPRTKVRGPVVLFARRLKQNAPCGLALSRKRH